ncbi:ABC transporter ATP-binding protein [Noviherbaspirillum sedimenti]|uniref:ABC transporter ATP-binding protein n=1 Tax=Noviherbaspirillum sedimenti TaxID=2320865 RepID=A0A3A3FX74_9BURK|nr:ABC transporter ATP-binding protein [Noviherbaspirillum sedimenti]RJG00818.1 ABC transporter ATP-binding protein [Noviherbaspirillum sedimenti]
MRKCQVVTREILLSVRDITVRFGGITALNSVSFDVPRGGVCGLIGPNGAGKTTLFNCLSRLYRYESGDILFEGNSISNLPVHRIASYGIGRTFQNLAMFRTLSVRQNIMIGAHCRSRSGFLSSALRLRRVAQEEARLMARANELLALLGLGDVAERPVSDLPFGIQKRVEFARALAADPKLILLDEPAAGLNHEELADLTETIRLVQSKLGITILLVEHHMGLVMGISDHIVVLNFGAKIAEGTPAQIQSNPDVIAAYLGAPAAAGTPVQPAQPVQPFHAGAPA